MGGLVLLGLAGCKRGSDASNAGSTPTTGGSGGAESTSTGGSGGGDGGGGPLGSWSSLAPSGGGAAGARGLEPGEPQAFTPANYDLNLVVGTGQSLATGVQGGVATREQVFDNLTLSLGDAEVPPFDPTLPELSLVPLVEPVHAQAKTYPSAYPNNINGETPHTAMSHQISALVQDDSGDSYVTVHSVVGESGQPMSVIEKGAEEQVDGAQSLGRAYAATLFEAQAIRRLAEADDKSFGVGAVFLTHGEADTGNQAYEQRLVQLWSDYNADLGEITGHAAMFPMILSQQHSVPDAVGSSSVATQAQWRVGVDHPGQIVCSGPKYQYGYAGDATHLRAPGYRMLGEKYGEVYFERVVLGNNWQPLHPVEVRHSRRVIEVRFHVPVPPLEWDDEMPAPYQGDLSEWKAGNGFEVRNDDDPVEISRVEIVDDDVVRITCAEDLDGDVELAYAWTAQSEAREDGTVRWGLLKDSDPFVGFNTQFEQPNYAVAFEILVP